MREIINTTSVTYICSFPDCQASYDKEWKLESHLCKHTGVRPFKCEYDGCSKSFCTKFHLSRHTLTHTGERPYKCDEEGCSQSFTTNSNLKKHIARKHKLEAKLYNCMFEGCGKRFKKNNQLKTHESTHTHQLPYKCSYEGCDRRFANSSKQRRHEKVHKGYPCSAENCLFVGKNWTELIKHRKEHKERVQCEECKKTFRDRSFLKQHQRVHSESRLVFYCPRTGCTRSYTTAFNLQSHILSFHEQVQAFTCTHPGCEKSFSMKQSLQRHCVVHDPERKKQRKPRPTRSLASRLSGYKSPRKSQSETSALRKLTKSAHAQEPKPGNEGYSYSSAAATSPQPSGSECSEISQPEPMMTEDSVVLILEPLVLVNSTSQSESSKSKHSDRTP